MVKEKNNKVVDKEIFIQQLHKRVPLLTEKNVVIINNISKNKPCCTHSNK